MTSVPSSQEGIVQEEQAGTISDAVIVAGVRTDLGDRITCDTYRAVAFVGDQDSK